MTEEKLKDMLKRCEKQFRMPTLFTRFVEPPRRPWVGLKQKERDDIWYSVRFAGPDELAKAIEAKLKERNG